jgi:hypothetical protein
VATTKKRITITLDDDTYSLLVLLCSRWDMTESATVAKSLTMAADDTLLQPWACLNADFAVKLDRLEKMIRTLLDKFFR